MPPRPQRGGRKYNKPGAAPTPAPAPADMFEINTPTDAPAPSPAPADVAVYSFGADIECNYQGSGQWHPGKIMGIRDEGKYDILFDDGDGESEVTADRIRHRGGGGGAPAQASAPTPAPASASATASAPAPAQKPTKKQKDKPKSAPTSGNVANKACQEADEWASEGSHKSSKISIDFDTGWKLARYEKKQMCRQKYLLSCSLLVVCLVVVFVGVGELHILVLLPGHYTLD